jgi:hypothetical protein
MTLIEVHFFNKNKHTSFHYIVNIQCNKVSTQRDSG